MNKMDQPSFYEKYIKGRYDSDAAYRERMKQSVNEWRQRKAKDPEFIEKRRAQARKYYQSNKEYRDAQRDRALKRYYDSRNERIGVVVILVQ